MNVNILLAEANPLFTIVQVRFPSSSKVYHYKSLLPDLVEGDEVLVDTPSEGLKVVTVVAVNLAGETNLDFSYNLKWIVQKVDRTHYERCMEAETDANRTINKLKASKQRREMMAELEEVIGKDGIEQAKRLVRL